MPDTSSRDQGLSATEAVARLRRDGPNELPRSAPRGTWRLLREVASEPMFLLLVGCGAVYLALGDRIEALMLLGFVFIVIGTTFFQQRRTERSLDALRDMASPRALVLREGVQRRIAGRELVVGDIVLLAEGDRVPADMQLFESANLTIDESMLTGESVPVVKHATDPPSPAAAQAYAGTLVTQGTGCGRVSATGPRSALGRIGMSLAALERQPSPVQRETARIVKGVAAGGLLLAGGLALAYGLLRGDWLHGLLAGLTLAMAVLPEELPVVLALFLALGAWRLGRARVLARSMPAIELLGATTVLCVDKTGTLTTNQMVLRKFWSDVAQYDCARMPDAPLHEELHALLEYAVLASHRRAYDPMETAIGAAGLRLLGGTEHLHADWTLVEEYPLSRGMLAMSRVWQSPDRRELVIAAKGAPEAIIDLCHLDAVAAAPIVRQVAIMASQGLRVLGVARASLAGGVLPAQQHDFGFLFLGLIALQDPVRPGVPAAIAECRRAGIRVVMITGDHPATALSIAREAGLTADAAPVTGLELAALDQRALAGRLADTDIYCRVRPEQKLRLVEAFRARGDIVAMTGDGVNDAPALKAAHIGVAMGARGTDVAREAAALVLLDDDFSSLLLAVRHGRRVYGNLRKAIVFVVAVHAPIVGLSVLPVLFGWPMLLMPVHILFLQLIIDPACTVVFESEPLEAGAMMARPRPPQARLFDGAILARGLAQGGGLLLLLTGVYALAQRWGGNEDSARALVFAVLITANLALIQANRAWSGQAPRRTGVERLYFPCIAGAAMVLLAVALLVPPVRLLFHFAQPNAAMLLAGAGAAMLAMLWFKAVNWAMSRRTAMRMAAASII
jgi:Ca2+-transporting ATPase